MDRNLINKIVFCAFDLPYEERTTRIRLQYQSRIKAFLDQIRPDSTQTWSGSVDALVDKYEKAFRFLNYTLEKICIDDDGVTSTGLALLLGNEVTNQFTYLPTKEHIRYLAGQHEPQDYHDMRELLLHQFGRDQSIVGYMARSQGSPIYVTDVAKDIRPHSY